MEKCIPRLNLLKVLDLRKELKIKIDDIEKIKDILGEEVLEKYINKIKINLNEYDYS